MAKRKTRAAARKTKSKTSKRKTRAAKKSVKRAAASRKSRRTSKKKVAPKTSRKRPSVKKRTSARGHVVPVVEGQIIDVVDQPASGVVRVTEIEATRVTVPDSEDDDDEE